jgi:hypothetical protein
MLFQPKPLRIQWAEIARGLADGTSNEGEAGKRMRDLDPEAGTPYLLLAAGARTPDDPDETESEALLWQGLERAPGNYQFYLAIADLLTRRDRKDRLAEELRKLAIWKVSFLEAVPDSVAKMFEGKSAKLDFHDPETYRMIVTAIAAQDKEDVPDEIRARLYPYQLLNDLQYQAEQVVDEGLLDTLLDKRDVCLPVWRAALREWGRSKADGLQGAALCFVIALIGETAGVEALDELLEMAGIEDQRLFEHSNWAIWRMGQRDATGTIQKFRDAIPSGDAVVRSAISDHIGLLPNVEGRAELCEELLSGFESIAQESDASYLLVMVHERLKGFGLPERAEEVVRKYEGLLPQEGRDFVRETLDAEEPSLSKLDEIGIEGLTIRDVVVSGALWVDEDYDEDEEVDLEDWDEDGEPHRAPERPGRNEPCWCGSGKKYKKCHGPSEEEAERKSLEEESVKADKLYQEATRKLLDAMNEIHNRGEVQEATRLFFGKKAEDVSNSDVANSGFLEWLTFDYRSSRNGRTLVEEYLRRRGPRLSDAERALVESWRHVRYGLFEVQKLKRGVGIEVRDVFAKDQFLIHDVSASKARSVWDCLFARVQEYHGKTIFSANALVLPRNVVGKLRATIEAESEAAGMPAEEYVRRNSHKWYVLVRQLGREAVSKLDMRNAEGSPIEFCSAEYRIRDREGLIAALRAQRMFEDVTPETDKSGTLQFGWLEITEGPRRSYGHIEIDQTRLKFECNSQKRLGIGRGLLEKYAGAFMTFENEEVRSLDELKESALSGDRKEKVSRTIPPEVEREMVLEFKKKHYADWVDIPLPGLDGMSPRAAARSEVGRRLLEEMLRDMENGEDRERQQGGAAFDFTPIRKTLGMDR